ncbi:MAG: carboxypeptidase-like regulatory domain-containing protein, partial [Flavihumibacter sp.]
MSWNRYWLTLTCLFFSFYAPAQWLGRYITVKADRYSVQQALELISNEGNFFFSYNSALVPRDSSIDYPGGRRTVQSALTQIFAPGFEFRESGNYIIIRRKPIQISMTATQPAGTDNFYLVSGYVRDDQTGEELSDASVYEKDRLQSSLTNNNGYFKLKLRSRYKTASLTVSKEFYQDTTVQLQTGFNQQLSVVLQPVEFYGSQV